MKQMSLDEYLRTSPLFRDLVEKKGIEWVKHDLKSRLVKEIELLESTPAISPELQKTIDELGERMSQESSN